MTSERKVDGWCAWHPEYGWSVPEKYLSFEGCDSELTSNDRAKGWCAKPVRITLTSEPTAAEARQAVIAEIAGRLSDDAYRSGITIRDMLELLAELERGE